MSKQAGLQTFTSLGLSFRYGSFEDVFAYSKEHPILLAPSGPGLSEIDRADRYREALHHADILLPDSGFLVLWKSIFSKAPAVRYSGYAFLYDFIHTVEPSFLQQVLWVMPDQETAEATTHYLHQKKGLEQINTYLAPWYEGEEIADPALINRIEKDEPSTVILCIAGGKQELLARFIQRTLTSPPPTYALGAAIAFMVGTQAAINPLWDKCYLGWLIRIITKPSLYLPRYCKAIRLAKLLLSETLTRNSN